MVKEIRGGKSSPRLTSGLIHTCFYVPLTHLITHPPSPTERASLKNIPHYLPIIINNRICMDGILQFYHTLCSVKKYNLFETVTWKVKRIVFKIQTS